MTDLREDVARAVWSLSFSEDADKEGPFAERDPRVRHYWLRDADAAIAAVIERLIADAEKDDWFPHCQECGGPIDFLRTYLPAAPPFAEGRQPRPEWMKGMPPNPETEMLERVMGSLSEADYPAKGGVE